MMEHRVLNSPASVPALPTRSVDTLPGPKGIPLFGNALQIKSQQLHLQLEAWARQYGPFYKLRLGPQRIMVVADHKAIGVLLRDRPEGFSRTQRIAEIWNEMGLPTGVFSANGDAWLRQRRMVMAGFDPGHVKRYFPALKEVAER